MDERGPGARNAPGGRVMSVQRSETYSFSKSPVAAIELVAGLGVSGDVHAGGTVRHRSRVAADPTQPNLRQLHLVAGELLDELASCGFDVRPGDIGENITTLGLDLLALPTGAVLRIGDDALVAVTGLRNPCRQLDAFAPGLQAAVLARDAAGGLVRKAGVMGVVLQGGRVTANDPIAVALPPAPSRPLACV